MAKHKVLKKCYLPESGTTEAKQYGPGAIIEYDGPGASYLQPVGDSEAYARWIEAYPNAPRSLPVGL